MKLRRRRRPTSAGIITVKDEDGALILEVRPRTATAVRYLATRLETDGRLATRMAFTSALEGEGVSFVSRAFAATLAHDTRRRVCVVDLNWWTEGPSVRRDEATSDDAVGISDVIIREKPLSAAITASSDSCLSFIAAGSASELERSTLARDWFLPKFLDELGQKFDHLVLDLPAILKTSDAIVLAEKADTTALVVQQGVTSVDQIESALRELGGHRIAGVVLNRVSTKIPRVLRRMIGI